MRAALLNRANFPPWIIASRHFNINPRSLRIQGIRETHRRLFESLRGIGSAQDRAQFFNDYMEVVFQLDQWRSGPPEEGLSIQKNSYLRYLRGWMFDSNSTEGAVLKAWVESRFGLPPTFHRVRISDMHSRAYFRYMVDRTRGSSRTNAINAQLDLLYEYVQFEFRQVRPSRTHTTLYRGVYDFSEHRVIEEKGKNCYTLQLNNLNSFTQEFERAWEFGTRVLEVSVPRCKIFYQCGILPSFLLRGEEEVMVIGGEYDVKVLTGG